MPLSPASTPTSWRTRLGALALLLPLAAAGESVTLSLPPASLANWYPPINKRQVWLHTMFGLREAMQAVEEYTAAGDAERTVHWAGRFGELYRKLPEMVPEWADEIEPAAAEALIAAARNGDGAALDSALHRLGTTCNGCHNEYQASVSALYRSPDYRRVAVRDGAEQLDYREAMQRLSRALNRVKIAFKDGRAEAARGAVDELAGRLRTLEASCATCHRDAAPRRRILGPETTERLTLLRQALGTAEPREIGRMLGEVGVTVCARCHATHRTLAGLRAVLDRDGPSE